MVRESEEAEGERSEGVSRRVECGVVDIYQRQVEVLLNLGSGGGGAVFF